MIQRVEEILTIDREDLEMTWRYAGYCKAERETVSRDKQTFRLSIVFSRGFFRLYGA